MLSLPADPFLCVEDRAAVLQPDGKRYKYPNDQPQGKQQDISANNNGQVEDALVPVTHVNAFVHAFQIG